MQWLADLGADTFQMYLDTLTYLDTLFMNVSRYITVAFQMYLDTVTFSVQCML